MNVKIEKKNTYAESSITVVGLTRSAYGRPQYFLVNSDGGENSHLKFPGLRFRAPLNNEQTLEDIAKERFEEQTGLKVAKNLGLRTIFSTRTRNTNQWMFSNLFFVVVDDINQYRKPDGNRKVYLADPGQGILEREDYVFELMNSHKREQLKWATQDNRIISKIATDVIYNFNWSDCETKWYKKIPCVAVDPLTESNERPLGCGLAVASMMLIYQSDVRENMKIILLKRKGDDFPGYAGGKIESLTTEGSINVDPVSCCSEEGAQEYGFPIQPKALICCACTSLDVENSDTQYNSIVNYSFVAEPTNLKLVEEALKNPRFYLEDKMESYVVESLDEHRDRISRRELRMPDMISIGEQFYATSPGEKLPLTHIRSSGIR